MPRFAPQTGVGRPAVQAYAAKAGLSAEDFLRTQTFALLTPQTAGRAIVELLEADAATLSPAYVLSGSGLQKVECLQPETSELVSVTPGINVSHIGLSRRGLAQS